MSLWKQRPSILSANDYGDAAYPRSTFLEHYQNDNMLAAQDGVVIHPRSSTSCLRTLQWNLNGWASDNGTLNSLTFAREITDAIVQADADCIILNEYHWNDSGPAHLQFEKTLRNLGYTSQLCGTVICPTFVATRWHTLRKREIVLSEERSALVFDLADYSDPGRMDVVTVVGTHLDHRDGRQRYKEMSRLLQDLFHHNRNPQEEPEESFSYAGAKMILAGDLNQQRQRDYPHSEWNSSIAPNIVKRKTCYDDGVDGLLAKENFDCAWNSSGARTNWATSHPPSTHWSGTIVDYSYGRRMEAECISISPAGWSDHRMTVVDWKW